MVIDRLSSSITRQEEDSENSVITRTSIRRAASRNVSSLAAAAEKATADADQGKDDADEEELVTESESEDEDEDDAAIAFRARCKASTVYLLDTVVQSVISTIQHYPYQFLSAMAAAALLERRRGLGPAGGGRCSSCGQMLPAQSRLWSELQRQGIPLLWKGMLPRLASNLIATLACTLPSTLFETVIGSSLSKNALWRVKTMGLLVTVSGG